MNEGFQFIDIIFFAMIAAFLVLRLRGALGRRDGHEGSVQNPFKDNTDDKNKSDIVDDNVIPLNDEFSQEVELEERNSDQAFEKQAVEKDATDELLSKGIGNIDPNFNRNEFLVGAKAAFEQILSAYSNGDTPSLKPLLNDDVFANFSQVIGEREQANHTMEDTLVAISTAEIVEAFAENNIENITVKYVSEQINVIRDENEAVVDGDPNAIIETTDFWTFARNVKSSDPNWTLVATNSLD
jgi:predicted lipid-binding transport protein (Tim44 family)